LSHTFTVFIAPSACSWVVYTLSPPTMTVVRVVGFCSTIVQRFVGVSWTMQNSAAIDGVTNAATIAAAIRTFILILSSWILESDSRLSGWVIRPTELGSLRRVLSASGSGTIVVRYGTKSEMP